MKREDKVRRLLWAFVSTCLVFLIVTAGAAFYGARQGVVEPTPFWVAELATLPPPQIDYFMPDFRLPTAPATGRDTAGSVVGIHPPGAGSVMATDLVQGNDENPGWGTAPTNTPSAQETVPPPPVETVVPTPPNDENPGWGTAPTNTPSAQETIPAPPTPTPPAQETEMPGAAGLKAPMPGAMGTPSIGPAPTLPPPVETITPTITPTSTPEPTPTVEPPPDPSRFCEDSEHDTTRMHGRYLHDADGNPICTFDHSHKPPNEGYPSALFLSLTGQQLSYPWATGNGAENLLWPDGKHEAYNWEAIRLGEDGRQWVCPESNCIPFDSVEVEWHGMASNKGFETRFHSFAALIRAGDGYIFWAGHMDCGQTVYIDGAPFVIDTSLPQPSGTALKHTQTSNRGQTWYCKLPNLLHQDGLPWGTATGNFVGQQYSVNLAPPTSDFGQGLLTVCNDTDPTCDARDQSKFAHDIMFDLSGGGTDMLDPDGNGVVEDFRAYLTRYGELNTDACGDPYTDGWANRGLDCVPFAVHDMQRGLYHMLVQNGSLVRPTRPDPQNNIWWGR